MAFPPGCLVILTQNSRAVFYLTNYILKKNLKYFVTKDMQILKPDTLLNTGTRGLPVHLQSEAESAYRKLSEPRPSQVRAKPW